MSGSKRRLAGKHIVVTAAGQGIGRASAIAFAAEGAEVLACDINQDSLASLEKIDGISTLELDLTDAESMAASYPLIGPVDVLFNCAGFVAAGSVLECEEDEWAFSFELNVTAMFRLIKLCLPDMLARGGGSIINMSSVVSSIVGAPNRFAYGVTKAAVIGLTKSIATDYVKDGIRCNAICPGTVETPSLHERLHATGDYEAAMDAFVARQPMGRLAKPEEVAKMALYLASDESAYVTGQTLSIDGGWTM